MTVKKYKPTTPGQRGMTGYTFEEITKSTPERSLTVSPVAMAGATPTGALRCAIAAVATVVWCAR